jgi:hypothetical protein
VKLTYNESFQTSRARPPGCRVLACSVTVSGRPLLAGMRVDRRCKANATARANVERVAFLHFKFPLNARVLIRSAAYSVLALRDVTAQVRRG